MSGYSPEIGDELDDDLYLNPNGCNRQFILLTTAQKDAPLLNIKFSTSRGILTQFIETNEAQLFALTARDAVAGELQNSVYECRHAGASCSTSGRSRSRRIRSAAMWRMRGSWRS